MFRFSLYGFLKNQRYFEPFLYLAFLEKGLSYFEIGILVAIRFVSVNIWEVPSGALADLYGRRKAMVMAFAAYIVCFITLALFSPLPLLAAGMFFMGIGDAFRTGTHKAMILTWLEREGRAGEKTKVYGYTRSWSKVGSAVSALIAGTLVFMQGNYVSIFWFATIPYAIDLINLATYPAFLDVKRSGRVEMRGVLGHLKETWIRLLSHRETRTVIVEAMSFHGLYETCKDYLQPIVMAFALTAPFLAGIEGSKRTAVLIGIVYSLLHLLESVAARKSHTLSEKAGSDDRAATFIWAALAVVMLAMLPFLRGQALLPAIAGFVVLAILNNVFRPNVVSRLGGMTQENLRATVLSVESQAKAIFVMIVAPGLGWLVDHYGFMPIAVLGILVAGSMIVMRARSPVIAN